MERDGERAVGIAEHLPQREPRLRRHAAARLRGRHALQRRQCVGGVGGMRATLRKPDSIACMGL
jgi:hypothetical protein